VGQGRQREQHQDRLSLKLAILDDYQKLALQSADWDRLLKRGVDISVFNEAFASEDDAARKLAPFEILVLMRERTPFPKSLIDRLPALKFISLTGLRAPSLDTKACNARRIPISNTSPGRTSAVTAELAFGLILAAARDFARAERNMRTGKWHEGLRGGTVLEGKRLGVLGLGKLGGRVARYAKAFGMDVVAWSQNLTAERAAEVGAALVTKDEVLATSDFVSIHLVLSERTRGLIQAKDIERMKKGAILINTSRGPIVDEAAMVSALQSGRLTHAALDVYDREPLPVDHPLRKLDNVTLLPHLGYVSEDVYQSFYGDSVENVLAWLDGKPVRLLNPEALA
jgi:phosphoglycerate dehydrogenase-like enzyme